MSCNYTPLRKAGQGALEEFPKKTAPFRERKGGCLCVVSRKGLGVDVLACRALRRGGVGKCYLGLAMSLLGAFANQ